MSFVCAYMLVFKDPAAAAFTGWLVAMTTRQVGHLSFEPKGYDIVNQATHEYKEAIKVGYNLRRKIILLTIWALSPLLLFADSTLLRTVEPHHTLGEFTRHLGYLWFALGLAGLLFRTLHLFKFKDVRTGLVWATKIMTDPFHDIKLYYRAPSHLLRGELIEGGAAVMHPGHTSD